NQDLPPLEALFGQPGMPENGQTYLNPAPCNFTFPANFAGSGGSVGTNPTSSAVFTVQKNGSTIGTITISTGGAFTFATTGGSSKTVAKDDRIAIVAPSPQDSTLADVT